jgi:hypothetical protein
VPGTKFTHKGAEGAQREEKTGRYAKMVPKNGAKMVPGTFFLDKFLSNGARHQIYPQRRRRRTKGLRKNSAQKMVPKKVPGTFFLDKFLSNGARHQAPPPFLG